MIRRPMIDSSSSSRLHSSKFASRTSAQPNTPKQIALRGEERSGQMESDSDNADDGWDAPESDDGDNSEDERKIEAKNPKKRKRDPRTIAHDEERVSFFDCVSFRQNKRPRLITKAPVRPATPFQRFLRAKFGRGHAAQSRKVREEAMKWPPDVVSDREEKEYSRWLALSEEERQVFKTAHDKDWDAYIEDVEEFLYLDPNNIPRPKTHLDFFREARPGEKFTGKGTLEFKKIPKEEQEDYRVLARRDKREHMRLLPFQRLLYDIEQYRKRFRPQNNLTAFSVFIDQRKEGLSKLDPPRDLNIAGEEEIWKKLSAEKKSVFEEIAKLGTAEYQAELQKFEEWSKVPFPGPKHSFGSLAFYTDVHREELKAQYKTADRTKFRVFYSFCAEIWRGLSDSEKQKYKSLCREARKESARVHAEMVQAYESVPWVKAYLKDQFIKNQDDALQTAHSHVPSIFTFKKDMARRIEGCEFNEQEKLKEQALFVDWRTLSKTEFGITALQTTDRLDEMVGWATNLTGPSVPPSDNPLLGLPNNPPRFSQLHDTILLRANSLTHQKNWLRNVQQRLDHSALVALGMLVEDAMTSLLLPFAVQHVQLCRDYESTHAGHSPDWILPPEKVITKLGTACPLITTLAPSRSAMDQDGVGRLGNQKKAWKSWCNNQGIDPDRVTDDGLFFFNVLPCSARADDDTDSSDDSESSASESSDDDSESDEESAEEGTGSDDSSTTASIGQESANGNSPQHSAASSVVSSAPSAVVAVEV